MSSIETKARFIKNLQKYQLPNAVDMVKMCVDGVLAGEDTYNILATGKHNPEKSNLKNTDMQTFYKQVYDVWYDYFISHGGKKNTNPKLNKENMTGADCEKFFYENYKYALSAQHGKDPAFGNNAVDSDFIHVHPFGRDQIEIEGRLYVNLTPENAIKVGTELIKDVAKRDKQIYFKFYTKNTRSDTFLIYTSYDDAPYFINKLREIKKKNPDWFKGSEQQSKTMPTIDNFITFGEEPQYRHSSYNLERAQAINGCFQNVVYPALENEYKSIVANNKSTIKSLLVDIQKKILLQKSTEIQKEILNRKYPDRYKTNEQVRSYIELETKIFNAAKTGVFPKDINDQFLINADAMIEEMRDGFSPESCHISFPTRRSELMADPQLADKKLKSGSLLKYDKWIKASEIEHELDRMFKIKDRIKSQITTKNIAPYFEAHHVSVKHPYLNTETVEELKTLGEIDNL